MVVLNFLMLIAGAVVVGNIVEKGLMYLLAKGHTRKYGLPKENHIESSASLSFIESIVYGGLFLSVVFILVSLAS